VNDHIDPTIALQRNISLLREHGLALTRLKDLEQQLTALDLAEAHEAQKYAEGYSNTAPAPRDRERSELTTLIAEARPAARAAELSIEPLMAAQHQIRARIAASEADQTKSQVDKLFDADLEDGERIDDLADGIRDILHRRKALRVFLGEYGRDLIRRGDVPHGVELLQQVEKSGAISVPLFEFDASKVVSAISEVATRFQKLKGAAG
jgi:hypothetical protein